MNLTPSVKKAYGANKKKDMIVIIEKRVILSNDSCKEKKEMYNVIALQKPMKTKQDFDFRLVNAIRLIKKQASYLMKMEKNSRKAPT